MWLLLLNAGVWGKQFATVCPFILSGVAMRLFELFEAKSDKTTVPATTPRNFVAKNAKTSGAGAHTSKKFNRKEKHKTADSDE